MIHINPENIICLANKHMQQTKTARRRFYTRPLAYWCVACFRLVARREGALLAVDGRR